MILCLKELLTIEKDWIPYHKPNHSLYIRPTSICMDNKIGLGRIYDFKTFIIFSPVGPYYPKGFSPTRLYCDYEHVRSWPHGFGDKKLGSNYAPTLRP